MGALQNNQIQRALSSSPFKNEISGTQSNGTMKFPTRFFKIQGGKAHFLHISPKNGEISSYSQLPKKCRNFVKILKNINSKTIHKELYFS